MKRHTRHGLSLENDLLRSTARRDAHEQSPIPPSRTDVRASTHTRAHPGIGIRVPSPRALLSNPVLCFLSPWSPALSSSRGGERARMLCNFDNQSHERRLIFIMITAASTSRMGTRSPIGGAGGQGEDPSRDPRNKGAASLPPEGRGGGRDSTIGLDRYNSRIDEPSASRSYLSIRVQRGGSILSAVKPEVPSGNPV